jgi:hypothetical protein
MSTGEEILDSETSLSTDYMIPSYYIHFGSYYATAFKKILHPKSNTTYKTWPTIFILEDFERTKAVELTKDVVVVEILCIAVVGEWCLYQTIEMLLEI